MRLLKQSSLMTNEEGTMDENQDCQPDPEILIKLANTRMPFGKYKDQRLIDLPEPYVVWFSQKGFPHGQLGDLLRMVYEIKVNGLEYLFHQLKSD
jgi:uncharacterized protein